MMARRLSRVALRTASGEASGVLVAIALPSLASTAGHMPSRADSHSGRASGLVLPVHGGGSEAFFTSANGSRRLAKNAAHEASTELGSSAHFPYSSSTKAPLPPYRNEVSVSTWLSLPESSAMIFVLPAVRRT